MLVNLNQVDSIAYESTALDKVYHASVLVWERVVEKLEKTRIIPDTSGNFVFSNIKPNGTYRISFEPITDSLKDFISDYNWEISTVSKNEYLFDENNQVIVKGSELIPDEINSNSILIQSNLPGFSSLGPSIQFMLHSLNGDITIYIEEI